MAHIAYFLHGRGRGHAARSLPIVRAMRALGHQVSLYGGGDALDLTRPDDAMQLCSPVLPGKGVLSTAWRRVRQDRQRLQGVDVVVSDGDMPSLIAARWKGLPCVAVGHELVFSDCVLPSGLPGSAIAFQRVNTWHSAALPTRSVAVHFLAIEPSHSSVVVARPDLASQRVSSCEDPSLCVAYFRDANGDDALRAAVAHGLRVICYGPANSAVAGVEYRRFDASGFAAQLASCRAVICSSGSNLLAECVQLQKPFLAVYRANDAEQRLNALLCERAGVAMAAELGDAAAAVAQFRQRLDRNDFATYPLTEALPSVTDALLQTVDEVLVAHRQKLSGQTRSRRMLAATSVQPPRVWP
jgi:UDP-N-acetylglucosamine--N-acetylmuramyl-(pentapeptide) pyrophosphoryl-undecaprenol N-acetylglucosamine transferase